MGFSSQEVESSNHVECSRSILLQTLAEIEYLHNRELNFLPVLPP